METNKIYHENCLETMKRMPDNFIDCVVTSPPYWGLRDYGHEDQIGLEATPEKYVAKMVEVFREVRRILKPEGTCWLNLGDSYIGGGNYAGWEGKEINTKQSTNRASSQLLGKIAPIPKGLKAKDLAGIPWRVAFALQADGWWLRQDIIWAKPNPMPESVKDRCTKAHEYIFLLTKSARYFYDVQAIEETTQLLIGKAATFARNGAVSNHILPGQSAAQHRPNRIDKITTTKRNKRSVWNMATDPFPEAHFATFPIELPSLCILAGSPKDGIVYDPFMGAATTALAALKYGRQFIGSEINPEYCEIGNKRIAPYLQQLTLAI